MKGDLSLNKQATNCFLSSSVKINPVIFKSTFPLYIRVLGSEWDKVKKDNAVPVTVREGQVGCETLRIPQCLDNRPTVNCEILATCSSTYSPVCTLQEGHSVSIK
jgi:hypothetical protein